MKHVVFGTHNYQWLMKPFGHLQNKYWPGQEIMYFCDRQIMDLPNNILVQPILRFNHWNWMKDFSQGIHAALKTIDDETVMISLPDMWPIRKVNGAIMASIQSLIQDSAMCQNKQIVRVLVGDDTGDFQYLGRDDQIHQVCEWNELAIKTCSPDHQKLRLCGGFLLFPSIWNVKLLLQIMDVSVDTDWMEWESHNTKRMVGTEYISCWVSPIHQSRTRWWPQLPITRPLNWKERLEIGAYLYPFTHVLGRSDKMSIILEDDIIPEDVKLIRQNCPPWVTIN